MKVVRSPKQIQEIVRKIKKQGRSIGFVPTMGALHPGHLSLIRGARKDNQAVFVSIFVNPIQFGPREDLSKYPRPIKKDIALCNKEGVDFIFYPSFKSMYPDGFDTYVNVPGLTEGLCGKFRPGHFKGVTTVVNKLFNLIQPDIAYFGQKDYQQALAVKKMAEDLSMPLAVKVAPTIREKDGLAMSSRNKYLNPSERKDAVLLYRGLKLARNLINKGNHNCVSVINSVRKFLKQGRTISVQYISIVDLKNIEPALILKGKVLIALAVYAGKTRLIDNIIVKI
ncbi:MAG: pantoate--beta-alanine ligase [Candidatus Omnitrophota bacterium]|nr:pantoate--beta-alanine ligase [Candidatus Omnitrophota bacterium]MBU1928547.1 pantoate--beta-alanine ligase [Candidatus Omnitrophota bacterium]MBU2034907.1 pantoate--beta-alanine ligase [Candidatus Omnitrophota bacterium]MBU2221365.1 pantoate--beta-alanine ligase [Candidatus Omnitrophota bacterium]MBU2258830.1 pantoate--beta-alanine ligase [Candidatus Omnitrophota bacterium]